jgi:hypothetical protein
MLAMMLQFFDTNSNVTEFKVNTYRMLAFILEANTPLHNELIEHALRQFKLSFEDFDRLKTQVHLSTLDRNITRFKLDHHIAGDDLPRIHDKIARGTVRASEAQIARVNKLYDHTWLP